MRLLVTAYDQNGLPAGSRVVEAGEVTSFHIPSPYLVSAGQDILLGVSVFDVDFMVRSYVPLADATHLHLVDVPVVWDVSFIPSTRTLADILTEVVQHGVDNPSHGTGCVCMDKYVREVRLQVSKVIPPDGRTTEEDWAVGVHERLEAKARIRHVLMMVERNM